jgi:DNA-binding GntR family transcriptional regulator
MVSDLGEPLIKETLANEVAERLRELIVTGRLPVGTKLHQEELSQALGVSRTPLRQALVLLVQEGFVHRSSSSQYTVASIDKEALKELYLVRRELDALAAEFAAQRHATEDLRELEHELSEMEAFNSDSWLIHHRRFHVLIYEASRNVHLLRNTPIVLLSAQMFYLQLRSSRNRMEEAHHEHQRIFQAIATGDHEKARREAYAHITNSLKIL